MKKQNRKLKVIPTERNKGLEPKVLGKGKFIVGYDTEIHEDDAKELTYRLPLGAVKRLIRSYYDEMKSIDESGVYYGQSGSYEIRMWPYCNRILANIQRQLTRKGLDGKGILTEVFNQYFKEDYEKMKLFQKNHNGQDVINNFSTCNDIKCCKPMKSS